MDMSTISPPNENSTKARSNTSLALNIYVAEKRSNTLLIRDDKIIIIQINEEEGEKNEVGEEEKRNIEVTIFVNW